MKRDLDLIRSILLRVEQSEGAENYDRMEEDKKVIYQVELLKEAGFIDVRSHSDGHFVRRLTWRGHDFLDAVRDDTVWNRTKEKISSTVGSASVEIVKAAAEGVTKAMLFGQG